MEVARPGQRVQPHDGRRYKGFSVTSGGGMRFVATGFAMGLAVSAVVSSLFQSSGNPATTTAIDLDMANMPQVPIVRRINRCDCKGNRTLPDLNQRPALPDLESVKRFDNNMALAADNGKSMLISKDSESKVDQDPTEPLGYEPIHKGIPDFDPTARAVIVTKIQNANTVGSLNQSLCLLSYAYNHRVNYDIVVFTATQISDKLVEMVRKTVAPANITFVLDNPGVQAMVDALHPDQREHLLNRCNATNSSELYWYTRCREETSSGVTNMPIQYNWQAEFRSLHLWKHAALAPYKYMIWMDTDGFCTKLWKQDPIAAMRRNDLAILFAHFPAGRANGAEFVTKINKAFGKNICEIGMRNGTLHAWTGRCKYAKSLRQIYGFFHVTDLDFYRSPPAYQWQEIMVGDSKFSRLYDDQIAVTMPAAVLAGNRSWHMKYFGLNLSVFHNFRMDGNKNEKVGSFVKLWATHGKERFPEAFGKCNIITAG